MNTNFKSRYRKWGEEQKYIPLGIFKLRLPFIHYRFELPEFIQGFILVALALAATAPIIEGLALVELFEGNAGLAFQVAVVIVTINTLILLFHPTIGDPVFCGWITPAIPLTLAHLAQFDDPISRLHAMRALQFTICLVFIFFGATGLAKKIIGIIPVSIRGGVLMGAAIVAVQSTIMPGGRMEGTQISTIVGLIITFLILYSIHFRKAAKKSTILRQIGKYGLLPGMIIALIVGMIIGELPIPTIQWGITPLPLGETFRALSVFTNGIPALSYFASSIPLVIAAYIIAFGDIVTAEAVVNEAGKSRPDEKIVYNPNITNIAVGIRNLIQSLTAPFVPMSGPLWTGGIIAVSERYRAGPKQMDSIYGGIAWFMLGKVVALFLAPMVSGLSPVFPVAMSITMIVTGWAAGYIAIQMLKTKEAQGIAILVGCAIAFQGAAVGLVVGVVCHLLIGGLKKVKNNGQKTDN